MRILVITPWFPTRNAPVSGVFVRREVEALAHVHEVTVIHLDWQRGIALEAEARPRYGYRHFALNRIDPRSYARARRIVAAAAHDHDVVHTHALTGLLPWVVGRPGLPTRSWVHSEHWSGISAPETLGRGERMALRVLGPSLHRADAVITESSRLASGVRRFRDGAVDIVPCVVERTEVFERKRSESIRLVGIGGLIPRKGPLLALSALSVLVARGIDAYLTWVGDGPQRAELVAEAVRLGVADRLRLTGQLDDRGVAAELAASTMFILPTQGDNFCVVAAEALMNGRPIVSGAATGAVDYAAPSVSRFVDVQTGDAYADAVQELGRLTLDLSAHDIAATVAGRFSPQTVTDQLTAVYSRVREGRHD